MKPLTQEQINKAAALLQEGLPSRAIAAKVGCGKTTVNEYRNRLQIKPDVKLNRQAKILFLDIETAAAVALAFGRFKQNLSQDNIVSEGGWMLCASWKWNDEEDTHSVHLVPEEIAAKDDSRIVAVLFDLYEQADAIVAHNGQGFDHKVIQTRAAANGFPALPSVKVIDTLLLAKKNLRLPSNRLDAIGAYLGLGRKIETGGISLWKDVQNGDVDAMKRMVTYCKQDVDLLYKVYMALRHTGAAGTNFNAALYHANGLIRCKTCASADIDPTGRSITTAVSVFAEYRCNSCGAVHRDRKNNLTKEQRESILQ